MRNLLKTKMQKNIFQKNLKSNKKKMKTKSKTMKKDSEIWLL